LFSYGLVENLILGRTWKKKSLKFRGIPVFPGALFFGKKIFLAFFQHDYVLKIFLTWALGKNWNIPRTAKLPRLFSLQAHIKNKIKKTTTYIRDVPKLYIVLNL